MAHSVEYVKDNLNANVECKAESVKPLKSVGYCLKCGRQLTKCGLPFSAEIGCLKCGAVNIYEDSQQPKCVKDAA